MSDSIQAITDRGELMQLLLEERERFETEEEFKEFALVEVRQFIADLRSLNIELSLRPSYQSNLRRSFIEEGPSKKLA